MCGLVCSANLIVFLQIRKTPTRHSPPGRQLSQTTQHPDRPSCSSPSLTITSFNGSKAVHDELVAATGSKHEVGGSI